VVSSQTLHRSSIGDDAGLRDVRYAVVDIETTGFAPRLGDRIVEIAMVRVSEDGTVEDEWSTLVNPLRDVGPTAIHGISPEDVAGAPTFGEIAGDVLKRLRGAVFVAHNAQFDYEFLATELSNLGLLVPGTPILCTLKLAYRLYPRLTNHQLTTCCETAGLVHEGCHEALSDAKATARLLLVLLQLAEAGGLTTLGAVGCTPTTFPQRWPKLAASGRICHRSGGTKQDIPYLARMVASLGSVRIDHERVAPYLHLLDRVLEDRIVTEAESDVLRAITEEWGLSPDEVMAAHDSYLESLITSALSDGRVTEAERRDLEAVTRLLCIDPARMHAMLSRARHERDKGPILRTGPRPPERLLKPPVKLRLRRSPEGPPVVL
jgi:DNA polymerase III epsilon subunit family exonuclease